MSQAIQSNLQAQVESLARSFPPAAAEDARQLFTTILHNLTAQAPGGNLLRIGGTPDSASAPPVGVAHSVVGANAQYSVNITNPPSSVPIYHELSFSPVKSFTKDVTTQPPTTATNVVIPAPGSNQFSRLRSSFDKKTWSDYQLSSQSSIDAGFVSSDALAPAAALNQTNFAVVNSQQNGGVNTITIDGTGGRYSPYVAIKGTKQSLRPSATIIGVQTATPQFIGWDGSQYQLGSLLPGVMPDNYEPVGALVVGSGLPGGGGVSGGNGSRLTAV